jgi:hypothetical protein
VQREATERRLHLQSEERKSEEPNLPTPSPWTHHVPSSPVSTMAGSPSRLPPSDSTLTCSLTSPYLCPSKSELVLSTAPQEKCSPQVLRMRSFEWLPGPSINPLPSVEILPSVSPPFSSHSSVLLMPTLEGSYAPHYTTNAHRRPL